MKTISTKFVNKPRVLLILTLFIIIIFQLTFTVQPVTGNGNVTILTPPRDGFNYLAPTVVTVGSADITNTTAIATGNLTAMGTASGKVIVYVKYGKTYNATVYPSWAGGITTPEQEMKEAGMFSADVSDLEPGTTYYFRAVAKGEGTFLGAVMTFVTSAGAE